MVYIIKFIFDISIINFPKRHHFPTLSFFISSNKNILLCCTRRHGTDENASHHFEQKVVKEEERPAFSPKPKGQSSRTLSRPAAASPYHFRGGHRERQHAQQSTTSTAVYQLPPTAERLAAPDPRHSSKNSESMSHKPNKQRIDHRNPYSFIMAPGYRTRK